jgi:hypothetical protein
MKTVILSVFFTFFYLFSSNFSYAQIAEQSSLIKNQDYVKNPDNITFTAEKPDVLALKGDINNRILKKYYPIRLSVKNKDKRVLYTGDKFFYTDAKGENHKIYGYLPVYEKAKVNTTNRAIFVGTAVTILTFGTLTLPLTAVSVTHSTTTNEKLESNLMKNTFRAHHLFKDDFYTAFVFIPRSQKNVSEITIKDSCFEDGEKFNLSAKVTNEN